MCVCVCVCISSPLQLRNDLGGIEYAPTILNLSFLEDGKISLQKFEGFQEIVTAFNSGRYRRTLEDWVERKIKRRVAEKMAEGVAGAFVEAAKEREARLRREYEEKLRQQREELRRKERQVTEERERREEEERKRQGEERLRRDMEELKLEEQSRRKESELREARTRNLAILKEMDLENAPVKEMKSLMTEMGISTAGLLNRGDYLDTLYKTFPVLQRRRNTSESSSHGSDKDLFFPSAGKSVVQRIHSADLERMSYGELKVLAGDAGFDTTTFSSKAEMIWALQRYAQERDESRKIGEAGDDPIKMQKLEGENRSLKAQLVEKDEEIGQLKTQVQELKEELDVEKRRCAVPPRAQASSSPVQRTHLQRVCMHAHTSVCVCACLCACLCKAIQTCGLRQD